MHAALEAIVEMSLAPPACKNLSLNHKFAGSCSIMSAVRARETRLLTEILGDLVSLLGSLRGDAFRGSDSIL
jgi:hypothetical protein